MDFVVDPITPELTKDISFTIYWYKKQITEYNIIASSCMFDDRDSLAYNEATCVKRKNPYVAIVRDQAFNKLVILSYLQKKEPDMASTYQRIIDVIKTEFAKPEYKDWLQTQTNAHNENLKLMEL